MDWQFSLKKINKSKYEIHILALIQKPWHIYGLNSPNSTSYPTKIILDKNPMIIRQDTILEVGKLKYGSGGNFHYSYFEDQVDFILVITLKSNLKTRISGVVKFMACTSLR